MGEKIHPKFSDIFKGNIGEKRRVINNHFTI